MKSIKIKESRLMKYETFDDFTDPFNIEVYAGLSPIAKRAIAIHAIVECWILHERGITGTMISKWDTEDLNGKYNPKMYNKNPYYKAAHLLAEKVERALVEASGLSWGYYSKYCDSVKIKWRRPKHEKQYHDK